jgi:NAD(P)H-hydrate repair Nnr-like enzyme with NAD(P)H-hydrate epimerase domain
MGSFFYKNITIPCVTIREMQEVDRLMMEEYSIQLLQMMENAGTALASLTCQHIGNPADKNIVILAGRGNNGGGGLVAARRLSN